MAGSVNKVILIGRLGGSPEIRYTPQGTPVGNFNLATSEKWKDESGERKEHTEWHRITVWGKLAENCAQYLNKGDTVYVEGRLRTNSYTDKDGNRKYTTEIRADTVQYLITKKSKGKTSKESASHGPASADFSFQEDSEEIPF